MYGYANSVKFCTLLQHFWVKIIDKYSPSATIELMIVSQSVASKLREQITEGTSSVARRDAGTKRLIIDTDDCTNWANHCFSS
jgi:hypothetical protein